MQGSWILEIGEIAGIRKVDEDTLKSFLTRQDDKFRASYGRVVEEHPRQCIIVGTTNQEAGFLRDTTGGRRFWPVKVGGISESKPWDIFASANGSLVGKKDAKIVTTDTSTVEVA